MPNINSIINKSNITKLSKEKHKETAKCNCKEKATCPLKGKYQQECVVYKVEVYSGEPCGIKDKKVYFGSTQGEFKLRYYNHRTSFSHEKYRHSTSLSNHVWEIKNKKKNRSHIEMGSCKRCRKYRAGNKDCMLCDEEKLTIASYRRKDMLNQRSEVLNDCKHKRSWLLYN